MSLKPKSWTEAIIIKHENFDHLSDKIVEVNNNGEWFVLYYSQLELCGVDSICNENKFSDDLRKELKEFVKKKWSNKKDELVLFMKQ